MKRHLDCRKRADTKLIKVLPQIQPIFTQLLNQLSAMLSEARLKLSETVGACLPQILRNLLPLPCGVLLRFNEVTKVVTNVLEPFLEQA